MESGTWPGWGSNPRKHEVRPTTGRRLAQAINEWQEGVRATKTSEAEAVKNYEEFMQRLGFSLNDGSLLLGRRPTWTNGEEEVEYGLLPSGYGANGTDWWAALGSMRKEERGGETLLTQKPKEQAPASPALSEGSAVKPEDAGVYEQYMKESGFTLEGDTWTKRDASGKVWGKQYKYGDVPGGAEAWASIVQWLRANKGGK